MCQICVICTICGVTLQELQLVLVAYYYSIVGLVLVVLLDCLQT